MPQPVMQALDHGERQRPLSRQDLVDAITAADEWNEIPCGRRPAADKSGLNVGNLIETPGSNCIQGAHA
jgi:hypothetical protein